MAAGTQWSDGPALEVPAYWLGDPSSGLRWPVDATFRAWATAALLVPPVFVVLWLVVPKLAVVLACATATGRYLEQSLPPRRYRLRGRLRSAVSDATGLGVLLLYLLVFPSPTAILMPLPWWLSLAVAPVVAALITRKVVKHVDHNRPYRYWLSLMKRVAAGPRARRAPQTHEAVPVTADDEADLDEYQLAALAVDPEEITVMRKFRPKTDIVEAIRWNPSDVEEAGQVIAWLRQHSFEGTVDRQGWLVVKGDALAASDIAAVGQASAIYEDAVLVKPGNYLIIGSGRVQVLSPRAVRENYIEVQP